MLSEEFAFLFFCKSWVTLAWFSKMMCEPSITALVIAVQKEWAGDSKNFQRQLIPRTSPVDDPDSNRAVEAMVHSLEGLIRTSKIALEESLGHFDFANFFNSAVAGETSKLPQKQICSATKWQNTVRRANHVQVSKSST